MRHWGQTPYFSSWRYIYIHGTRQPRSRRDRQSAVARLHTHAQRGSARPVRSSREGNAGADHPRQPHRRYVVPWMTASEALRRSSGCVQQLVGTSGLGSDWEAECCRVAEAHPQVRLYVKDYNLGALRIYETECLVFHQRRAGSCTRRRAGKRTFRIRFAHLCLKPSARFRPGTGPGRVLSIRG